MDETALMTCGVNFCPQSHADTEGSNHTNLAKPPMSKIYTMASIYLVCSVLSSIIIAFLVDPLTRYI